MVRVIVVIIKDVDQCPWSQNGRTCKGSDIVRDSWNSRDFKSSISRDAPLFSDGIHHRFIMLSENVKYNIRQNSLQRKALPQNQCHFVIHCHFFYISVWDRVKQIHVCVCCVCQYYFPIEIHIHRQKYCNCEEETTTCCKEGWKVVLNQRKTTGHWKVNYYV